LAWALRNVFAYADEWSGILRSVVTVNFIDMIWTASAYEKGAANPYVRFDANRRSTFIGSDEVEVMRIHADHDCLTEAPYLNLRIEYSTNLRPLMIKFVVIRANLEDETIRAKPFYDLCGAWEEYQQAS
jgi:hypothetical protein